MTIRTVTLTAVAALSLGMAAHAQETRTITVPLTEPGAAAPAQSGPGTILTVNPDGTTSVETSGAEPTATNTAAPATASTDTATAVPDAVAQAVEQNPADSTEPVAGTPAATADAPMSEGTPGEAPADESPAAIQNPETTAEDTAASDLSAVTEPGESAEATAEADAPVIEPVAPGDETPEPVEAEAPVAESPTVDAEAPAADVDAPAADAEAPAADAEAPAADAEAPAADAEAPAAEAPAEADIPAASVEADSSETEAQADVAVGEIAEGEDADEVAEPAAAVHEQHVEDVAFSFEGPFGKFDQFQLQRGLQVYTEVCASCHGLKQVPLRTLADSSGPGLPEDQVRAYAKEMTIFDAELDDDRERLPTDNFPTVTGEGMGPDLSLMAKARAGFHGPYGTGINQLFKGIGGPEYIHAILTGYTGETKDEAGSTFYENTAFPGGWIAMPPPLSDDLVEFQDGAPNDMDSVSKDLSAFLMWTAEPKMMARKQVGLVSVLFLIVLSALLYLTNKRLWWPLKHRRDVPGDGR